MLSIARLAMKGPLAAALSATVYALLALAFAPFLVISGGIVCLSGLRHGVGAGLKVALSAALISGGVVFLLAKGTTVTILLMSALVPLVGLAAVLGLSQHQGLSVCAATAMTFLYALSMRIGVADIEQFWLQRLSQLRDAVEAQGGQFLATGELSQVAAVMHASTILLVMVFFTGALLLGRWWQASLYNPGGFGTEFRQLLIPRPLVVATAVISVAALIVLNAGESLGMLGDALILVMILFALQGLAIVHYHGKRRGLANAFFAFLYVFLIFLPHIVGAMLTFIGIIDNVVDFRKLRGSRGQP